MTIEEIQNVRNLEFGLLLKDLKSEIDIWASLHSRAGRAQALVNILIERYENEIKKI